MKYLRHLILALLLLSQVTLVSGKPPVLSEKHLASPPPRIIRPCCSFGSDLRLAVIPVVTVTHIASLATIGPHQYLGHLKENNGIIYTKNGGFIDLGHLRDLADWTAYLHAMIRQNQGKGEITLKLGHEGGFKTLLLNIPASLNNADAVLLAGRIAYDLSVWHEIATWFGASYIPLVTERYSSFSIEDAYSNLLGVTLSMEALQSDLPYEAAMTQLLAQTLRRLDALSTEAETYAAMEAVHNVWWTREKRIPSARILLERQIEVYAPLQPMLVPGLNANAATACILTVPEYTLNGRYLQDFYQLSIKPNYKVPYRAIFPNQGRRILTQRDFSTMLHQVAKEWQDIQLQPTPVLFPSRG
ncbi:MAG: hypothetical protein AVDCRST_MAG95-2547 [uncultured Adhaeribacter sp.]|uniref:DUF4056 domain-containing protein n=1 Tax=uncultured Adhaeribacter sp. TaxID=448109 RepID=A0A6J4IZN9_9BACT|nr:MAG: hypothetical protein AVDCRST_MAG95-2547 [uncultured Adhaeribacter sp.]